MSRASFPRTEHAALLRDGMERGLRTRRFPLEITERGLDHYRCCYLFGFRRSAERAWTELSIHFQVAERLEASQDEAELRGILDAFLQRAFGA